MYNHKFHKSLVRLLYLPLCAMFMKNVLRAIGRTIIGKYKI